MDELLESIKERYKVTAEEAENILDRLVNAEKNQRKSKKTSKSKANENHGILDTIGGLLNRDGQGVNLTDAFNDLFHRGQEIGDQIRDQGGLAGVVSSLLGQMEPQKITGVVDDLLNRPKPAARKKSTSAKSKTAKAESASEKKAPAKKTTAKKKTTTTKSKTAKSDSDSATETPKKKPAAKKKTTAAKKPAVKKTTASKKSKSE